MIFNVSCLIWKESQGEGKKDRRALPAEQHQEGARDEDGGKEIQSLGNISLENEGEENIKARLR